MKHRRSWNSLWRQSWAGRSLHAALPNCRINRVSVQGHVKQFIPDNDAVERMFYNMCEERCHYPSQSTFGPGSGILQYCYGLEIFAIRNGWNKSIEASLGLALMMFPVFAVTTLGESALAQPICILYSIIRCLLPPRILCCASKFLSASLSAHWTVEGE